MIKIFIKGCKKYKYYFLDCKYYFLKLKESNSIYIIILKKVKIY